MAGDNGSGHPRAVSSSGNAILSACLSESMHACVSCVREPAWLLACMSVPRGGGGGTVFFSSKISENPLGSVSQSVCLPLYLSVSPDFPCPDLP